mgnify:CR=1 FL=1
MIHVVFRSFFFQAEGGIRDLVRSRGLGDVYKRQVIQTPRVAERGVLAQKKSALSGCRLVFTRARRRLSLIHI